MSQQFSNLCLRVILKLNASFFLFLVKASQEYFYPNEKKITKT